MSVALREQALRSSGHPMTSQRSALFLGAALLAGGALFFQARSDATSALTAKSVETAPLNAGKTFARETQQDSQGVDFAALDRAAARTSPPASYALSGDATAVLAERIALQALAEREALQLSERQWTGFAGVTQHHQAIRRAFEAEIAVLKRSGNGRHRFEIPLYPRAGDQLRTAFYASLRAELGQAVAAKIADKLGARLEDYFGGFGVTVQTLDFVAGLAAEQRDFVVTRTEIFWNQFRPDERLKTRRETFLIAAEDPAGGEWGALIARLSVEGEAGRSGS